MLKLFSKRSPNPAATEPASSALQQERELLAGALYQVLETLPQSFSGRENIRILCNTLAASSTHLRLVWVGFSEGVGRAVQPFAVAGRAEHEAGDWSLPPDCFDPSGPSQQALGAAEAPDSWKDLFSPWRNEPEACTVRAAMSLPLRSEKPGLRGMLVFYADQENYFDQVGLPLLQSFSHVAEIVWKQSNLVRVATQVAQQDPLTGLYGRRHSMTLLEKEIARAERRELPLSVLLCRVEGLAKLNDMYGLHATDAILAAFAKDAGELLGSSPGGSGATCGRWSGTRFLFILPQVDHERAEALAVLLREHFHNTPINVRNWSVRLALKVGSATYTRHSLGLDDLILHAHHSLAQANDELPSSVL